MNALLVDYDPFAMESRVSIFAEGERNQVSVCSDLTELVAQIATLAYEHNVYSVKFHGPFAITGEVRRAIEEYEKNQYSNNKITVEGI